MKRLKLFLICFLAGGYIYPQTDSIEVKFDASIRYRFESWNGMNAKNYGNDGVDAPGSLQNSLLFQRIIAGFTVDFNPKYSIAAHIQDSRAFGWSLRNSQYPDLFNIPGSREQQPYFRMNPHEQFFEIHDAWFEAKQVFSSIDVKAGRQKIFYGDSRIFGPGDWGNTGRWTWDAIKLSYRKRDSFIDIFGGGTKINDPEKTSIPFTKTEFWGGGIYAHHKISRLGMIEPFYALKIPGSADFINTLDFTRQWVGTRLYNEDFYSFLFDFLSVYQFGVENERKIDAYGIFLKAGYQFMMLPGIPLLTLRKSYASGGKSSERIHSFEPAFGAADKFYGWMNIASWSNLDNREIVLEFFHDKDLWVELKYNVYYIPSPGDAVILGNLRFEPGKSHLGDEFNMFIRYRFREYWQFAGVLGYFIPGDVQEINNRPARNASMFGLQLSYSI